MPNPRGIVRRVEILPTIPEHTVDGRPWVRTEKEQEDFERLLSILDALGDEIDLD